MTTPREAHPVPSQRPAKSRSVKATRPRIALALAGGGPLGAIYEIGALCALADSLEDLDLNRCDHYVGVSAGGFIAAGLANGITPRELCEAFIEDRSGRDNFDPAWLLKPAWGELASRLQRVPGLLGSALWAWGVQGKTFTNAFERLGAALPTGVLDNEGIHQQIERLFSQPGRTNDFRELRARLTLVATQLDTVCRFRVRSRPARPCRGCFPRWRSMVSTTWTARSRKPCTPPWRSTKAWACCSA